MYRTIAITILFIIPFSFSFSQSNIAVIPLEGKGVSSIEASVLTDRLTLELFATGRYTVLERGNMEAILNEQDFQLTGCVSEECIIEVGELLGVEGIVAGSVSKIGETFTIGLRLIDVETGKLKRVASYDHSGLIDQLLSIGIPSVARRLSGQTAIPSQDSSEIKPTESQTKLSGVETEPPAPIEIISSTKRDLDWFRTPKYQYRFHIVGGMYNRGDPEEGATTSWSYYAASYNFSSLLSIGLVKIQPSFSIGSVGYEEPYDEVITERNSSIEIEGKMGFGYYVMMDLNARFGRDKIGWAISSGIGISSANRQYSGGGSGGIDFPWEESGTGVIFGFGLALYAKVSPLYIKAEQFSLPPPMIEIKILYDTYIGKAIPVVSIGFGLFLRN